MIKDIKIIPDDPRLYIPDDTPEFVERYRKTTARKPRTARTDLARGMVVVVLEGVFASRRVIYLGGLGDNLALCVGPKSINNIPLFKIDERYLLATSTVLEIGNVDVDEKNAVLTERDVYTTPMSVEMTDSERKLDEELTRAVRNVEFMKTYLCEPFEVDGSRNFYSLKY